LNSIRSFLKRLVFGLLGKDPEAVVVSFHSGDEARSAAMAAELRRLVAGRRHFEVRVGLDPGLSRDGSTIVVAPGSAWRIFCRLRRFFRRYRIGQAAVLFDEDRSKRALRLAAWLLAPGKILAYNAALERHHLCLRCWIASLLFIRGVPLDRIFLRPKWLYPFKRDRSSESREYSILEGRALSENRPRVAVLSPYFPYPLAHGGAVRIFNLLKEAARSFDLLLFAFTEDVQPMEPGPVLEFCSKVVLVPKPRYREPRWASLRPPEVNEYRSKTMRRLLAEFRLRYGFRLLQVEYTQLASYGGEVLVKHDVTTDLYNQVHAQRRNLATWWDLVRWRRFENRAVRRYRRVVAMSAKDKDLLGAPRVEVIPNGVDLERFQPAVEAPGERLLFIGSFRHFPNVIAYRFFVEEVWPLVRQQRQAVTLTVVAGPDLMLYWRAATGLEALPRDERIRLLGFVGDVRPLYEEANLVIVPTLVSAGTNIKVLEAMAMQRAVISTSSGCAGLGLEHGRNIWVADKAASFAAAIGRLLADHELRAEIARAGRRHVEAHYDWRRLGILQRRLWRELLGDDLEIRPAATGDLEAIEAIDRASPGAAQWAPASYLAQNCLVAVRGGRTLGFIAYRNAGGECEILNLAVSPEARRTGIGGRLVEQVLLEASGPVFLEVRVSNHPARRLYEALGFKPVGLRPEYYRDPPEDGIVMRF